MRVEPVRVLHLINSQQRRGAEVFAAQLASCSQKGERFENLVCSLYDRGDDSLPLDGVPVFKLESRERIVSRLALDPMLLARLCRLLKKHQPEVIVAHGGDTLKYSVSTGPFYRKAVKVYRNIGTASVWANSVARVKLNRFLLNRIDAVVSVSESVKEDFVNVYRLPQEKLTFIPNGVALSPMDAREPKAARTEVRRELGLSEEDLTIISVGDLSPEKGYQNLLSLMGKLRDQGLKSQVLLVGDGPLRQALNQQAKMLGLAGQIHFLGRRSDVPQLLAASDIFVLSSSTEGMPAVLIEAGLSGLPSVAFDVGGVAEVVKHQVTGLLARPGDLEGLGQALLDLSGNPQQRAEMGQAARLHCQQEFEIHQVTRRYEDLYLQLLGSRVREKLSALG